MNTLPDDAPERLVRLLQSWWGISRQRPPTQDDFAFDDLVKEHPGLLLLKPIWKDDLLTDFEFARVGPEHDARNGRSIEGLPLAKVQPARPRRHIMKAFSNALNTGEPHYWEIVNTVFGSPPDQYVRLLLPLHDSKGNTVSLLASCIWADNTTKNPGS